MGNNVGALRSGGNRIINVRKLMKPNLKTKEQDVYVCPHFAKYFVK
jgi:hypothetical protein